MAFFLAGLVMLGGQQNWRLQPLVAEMDSTMLFFGSTALTAITDNAALTYLGSLVESISNAAKYALVADAMTDGRLAVIANAPNSAGFSMLKKHSMNIDQPASIICYDLIANRLCSIVLLAVLIAMP